MISDVLFYLLAAIILVFSVLSVTSRRVLRAAVYLLFVLISTSGLYAMLSYNFLAAVQLTVYAGGIVVLIIFSILLTSHIRERARFARPLQTVLSALAAGAGALLTLITLLRYQFPQTPTVAMDSEVQNIGRSLVSYDYKGYALPFEVVSVLLLAAMIGAIVVARKEKLVLPEPDINEPQQK